MHEYIDPRDLGALGDGAADDTAALQKAIDLSAESGRAVYLEPGVYLTRELLMKPHVVFKTDPSWAYGRPGRAVLSPLTDEQDCVLDLAHANGATLEGLSIVGNRRGKSMCGITMRKDGFGPGEDAFRIEKCMVTGFSGHAVFLNRVWCFSVRSCMFGMSGGDGLRMHGWDAFIIDNWFSGNGGAGFGTENANCSVTMTGNRVEWNRRGGIVLEGGSHYNITGNYIDRSGCGAIVLRPRRDHHDIRNMDFDMFCYNITATGNVIYRSGKDAVSGDESCHILLDRCLGCTVTGNAMCIGRDDGWTGRYSPDNGIIVNRLCNCVVAGNTLMMGALKQLVVDRGGHGEGVVIRDNVGTLVPPESTAEGVRHPVSIPHMMDETENAWFKSLFSD